MKSAQHARRSAVVLGLGFLLAAQTASAGPPRTGHGRSLGCSVEGIGSDLKQARFCRAVGFELGTQVRPLPDARQQKRGEAVQIFYRDVQLVVALVRDGKLKGWTRVPRDDKPRAQPGRVARAVRQLRAHAAPEHGSPCVRLQRKVRGGSPDEELAFPWEEFAHCESRLLELIEPWE